MKKSLAVLLATSALTAAVGIPTWSAMRAPANAESGFLPSLFGDGTRAPSFILASDDDDDHRYRANSRRGHDEDDDEDEDDDDEHDDDDDDHRGGARNAAPAGTAAPPQNGLFGNGAPPTVRVN